MERIRETAKANLETLAARVPNLTVQRSESRYGREASLVFASDLASVKLKLSVRHDDEVQNVSMVYHLEILPIFVQFEPHSHFEGPLEGFDFDAMEAWLDDRIVAFVKTYLSLQFANNYQMGRLVTDPVAGITFPEGFAKATLEHDGCKYYFVGEETKRAFAAENKSPCKSSGPSRRRPWGG